MLFIAFKKKKSLKNGQKYHFGAFWPILTTLKVTKILMEAIWSTPDGLIYFSNFLQLCQRIFMPPNMKMIGFLL